MLVTFVALCVPETYRASELKIKPNAQPMHNRAIVGKGVFIVSKEGSNSYLKCDSTALLPHQYICAQCSIVVLLINFRNAD